MPRHPAARAAGFGTDAGKPRDEATAKQREPRRTVARDFRVAVGCRHRAFDSGLNRAADPAELLVVGKLQRAASAVFQVELLQREGEQR